LQKIKFIQFFSRHNQKKTDKTPKNEIEKANNLRTQYLKEKKQALGTKVRFNVEVPRYAAMI